KNKLFIRITPTNIVLKYDLKTMKVVDEIANVDSQEVSQLDNDNCVYMLIDGTLHAYNIQTKEITKTKVSNIELSRGFKWIELAGEKFPGQTLVFITKDSTIHKYNPQTKYYEKLQGYLTGEPIKINSLTEGPDGNIYAGGGGEG